MFLYDLFTFSNRLDQVIDLHKCNFFDRSTGGFDREVEKKKVFDY